MECWAGSWNTGYWNGEAGTGALERWNTGTMKLELEHRNWRWNAGTVTGIVGGEGLEHWNTGS